MSDPKAGRGTSVSRRPHARIVAAAPVPLICLDRAGVVLTVNAAAAALLKASRRALVGRPLQEFVERGREGSDTGLTAILSEVTWRGTLRLQGADGTPIEVEGASAQADTDLRVVVFHDLSDHRHTEHELRRTSDRYRRLSDRTRRVREEERARLSRDLHDRLGQSLTGLKMDLAWLLALCDRFEPTTARSAIAVMMDRIDTTIAVVRRLSSELRPGVLDRLGLQAAIEWRAAEFERRSGVRCRVLTAGPSPSLDTLQSTELFRVFEEVLTNVGRHAQATRVRITMRRERDKFALHVYDNGRGIPSDAVDSEQSLGLIGMRERATLLGGTLTVTRGRRRGTLAVVRIPLKPRLVARISRRTRPVTEHD